MNAYIKAIEYYLPKQILTNEELAAEFPEWNAAKIFKKTGIKARHVAAADETAADMAVKAAEKLFVEQPDTRQQVDFVLFCTQSPDYKLPTSACIIQKRLGLPTSIGATDFDLGCSGYVYGLAFAKSLIVSGMSKNVLLLTGETYSKYCHPKDKGNRSIFGDGASATLVSDNGFARIENFVFGTDGCGEDNLKVKTGGSRFPEKEGVFALDDSGYVNAPDFLYMNGPEIFNFTLDNVPVLVDKCLKVNNLTMAEIDRFVFHQANKYMLETLRTVMKIDDEYFFIDLSETGNTVSSSVAVALKNAQIKGNQKVMIAGFGVGYSYAACVLKY